MASDYSIALNSETLLEGRLGDLGLYCRKKKKTRKKHGN
jgi:hypothetical protein